MYIVLDQSDDLHHAAMLESLFDDLEATHGKVLVSHVLAYLTAAQFGLSEPEILDILSTDEEVCASLLLHAIHTLRLL